MRKTELILTPDSLIVALQALGADPEKHQFILAYSGGVDSHVLLHLAVKAGLPVTAVHVNHGLSANADAWQQHCQQVCDDLAVTLHVEKVQVKKSGGSLEASARLARYHQFSQYITGDNTVLLTAHHQDDQAETVMLRLLRGSGLHGWAGMRPVRPFAGSRLLRPLLDFRRQQLLDYANTAGLQWIEDESNINTTHDRNFLRHDVLPMLEKRWPQAAKRIAMVAADAREAAEVLDQLADLDLQACRHPDEGLDVAVLGQFDRHHQALIVRLWLRENGFAMPSRVKLGEILGLIQGQPESVKAVCRWADAEVWRYHHQLVVRAVIPEFQTDWCREWQPQAGGVNLPELALVLETACDRGAGLKQSAVAGKSLRLSLRQGGEHVRLPGRNHHHVLKKLYQEAAVPPWLRNRLPLVYVEDELAAVAGLWVFAPFACKKDEPGYQILVTETNKKGGWHNAVV